MTRKNFSIHKMAIFKHVDYVYDYFVGRNKNIKLSFLLHNGSFNRDDGIMYKLIEKIKEKNKLKSAKNNYSKP